MDKLNAAVKSHGKVEVARILAEESQIESSQALRQDFVAELKKQT